MTDADLYTAAAAAVNGQLTVDSLTYGTGSVGHSSSGLQNLDVTRTSLHDALDSLLIHAVTGPTSTPDGTGHSLVASAGCVLNPIDKLYSMQSSYFSCAD